MVQSVGMQAGRRSDAQFWCVATGRGLNCWQRHPQLEACDMTSYVKCLPMDALVSLDRINAAIVDATSLEDMLSPVDFQIRQQKLNEAGV